MRHEQRIGWALAGLMVVMVIALMTGMAGAQESAPTTNTQTRAAVPGYEKTANEVVMTPGVSFKFLPNTNKPKLTGASFDAQLQSNGVIVLFRGVDDTTNVVCTLQDLVDTGKSDWDTWKEVKESMVFYAEGLLK